MHKDETPFKGLVKPGVLDPYQSLVPAVVHRLCKVVVPQLVGAGEVGKCL